MTEIDLRKLFTIRGELQKLNSHTSDALDFNTKNHYLPFLYKKETTENELMANALLDIKSILESLELRIARLEKDNAARNEL